ncbi:hypothetical protein [Bacillus cereus group sp. TH152-1LC]|uniref:hypothetical protein n=1 Tax=Bacillus cereus group sp. TH152-1LC TaxID=3018060 RepID=UPI0022DF9A10|nr:hypothetical protein [Bacillus cereus group sp. TH152-1LC]MDA1675407.1 hypothetical protein [Bacillus cereus group sp. TH152-1LC]
MSKNGKDKSKKDEFVHHNNYDIAQKHVIGGLKSGNEIPDFFGIGPKKFDRVENVQLDQVVYTFGKQPDLVLWFEGDTLVNWENQSIYEDDNVERFYEYYFRLRQKFKGQFKDFYTLVVYLCKRPESGVIDTIKDSTGSFKMLTYFVGDETDGDEKFQKISAKIKENPKVQLDEEEKIELLYNAFKNNKVSVNDRALEILDTVIVLEDKEEQYAIMSNVLVMGDKKFTDEVKKLIKEALEMNSLYDEILYGDKIKEYEKEIILNMISEGFSNKQIMKLIPKLEEEKIEELRRMQKNEK